jgi:hypothetical protein
MNSKVEPGFVVFTVCSGAICYAITGNSRITASVIALICFSWLVADFRVFLKQRPSSNG